jgi:hypothetical protein
MKNVRRAIAEERLEGFAREFQAGWEGGEREKGMQNAERIPEKPPATWV